MNNTTTTANAKSPFYIMNVKKWLEYKNRHTEYSSFSPYQWLNRVIGYSNTSGYSGYSGIPGISGNPGPVGYSGGYSGYDPISGDYFFAIRR